MRHEDHLCKEVVPTMTSLDRGHILDSGLEIGWTPWFFFSSPLRFYASTVESPRSFPSFFWLISVQSLWGGMWRESSKHRLSILYGAVINNSCVTVVPKMLPLTCSKFLSLVLKAIVDSSPITCKNVVSWHPYSLKTYKREIVFFCKFTIIGDTNH